MIHDCSVCNVGWFDLFPVALQSELSLDASSSGVIIVQI